MEFRKQNLEDSIEVPVCNGFCGKAYKPVNISYNSNDGEIKIKYLKKRDDNERENNRKI